MQNLVLSALPDDVANPGPDFWDMAWRDLAELVERGSLPCCSSPRARSVERQRASAAQSGAERQMGQPSCCCSIADQELQQLVLVPGPAQLLIPQNVELNVQQVVIADPGGGYPYH